MPVQRIPGSIWLILVSFPLITREVSTGFQMAAKPAAFRLRKIGICKKSRGEFTRALRAGGMGPVRFTHTGVLEFENGGWLSRKSDGAGSVTRFSCRRDESAASV